MPLFIIGDPSGRIAIVLEPWSVFQIILGRVHDQGQFLVEPGAIWFGHKDQPTRVASNGTVAAATLPDALSSPIR